MIEREGRGGRRPPGPAHSTESSSYFRTDAQQPDPTQFVLGDDDLLGSFDEEVENPGQRRSRQVPRMQVQEGLHGHRPVTIVLPPRPDEISPDYVPPLRSPRRPSFPYLSAGPSSPPHVSDAGGDIIFHPALAETGSVPQGKASASPLGRRDSGSLEADSHDWTEKEGSASLPSLGGAHANLLHSLTATKKVAAKWRSVLEPPDSSLGAHLPGARTTPSFMAEPIDVTHTTPFRSNGPISAAYVAPSGAPGFRLDVPGALHRPTEAPEHNTRPVNLISRHQSTQPVLSAEEARELRGFLPPRQRMADDWSLLFSLDQHGSSLSTLYRSVDKFATKHKTMGNILVVLAANGVKFGVYMNEPIVRRDGSYYGSGESFLFKILPGQSAVKIFRWTGKNQYFALCEGSFISFGGGSGTYGLLLDATFSRNTSATCPAYDNEVLCDFAESMSEKSVSFVCVGVEVWATGP